MIKTHRDFPNLFADKLAYATGIDPEKYNDRYFEQEVTAYSGLRTARLMENPLQGNYDLEHLCKIHEFLFSGVSSYAGSVRGYNIQGHGSTFGRHQLIHHIFSHQIPKKLEKIAPETSINEFARISAEIYHLVNYAHPFREGNGRSGRVFIEQLASGHGYTIHLGNFKESNETQWREACQCAFRNNCQPLINIFREQIMPRQGSRVLALLQVQQEALKMDPEKAARQMRIAKIRIKHMKNEELEHYAQKLYKSMSVQTKQQKNVDKGHSPGWG